MCGRFTVKATWAELVAMYRLTMDAPPHNLRPRYNVCPTDPVDVVTVERQLVTMRWGLVPWWWSKPLKNCAWRRSTPAPRRSRPSRSSAMRSSARAVSSRCQAITNGRTPRGKAAVVFHRARWLAAAYGCWSLGRVEKSRDWRADEVLHHDRHRAQ